MVPELLSIKGRARSGRKTAGERWAWALALAAGSVLVYTAAVRIDRTLMWSILNNARPAWLMAAVFFNLAILFFWAWQWKLFLPSDLHVPWRRMLEINAYMSMTMNTVPWGAGHALGAVLLGGREKAGADGALSVLALDQLAEGLAKLALMSLVLVLVPMPAFLMTGMLTLLGAVLLLLAVLLFLAHKYRRPPAPESGPSRLTRLTHFAARWGYRLEALRNLKVFAGGVALALAMKGAEGMAVWAVLKGLGVEAPPYSAPLVLACVSLATMLPLVPANLGVYEAAVFGAYRYLGLSTEAALGLALVQHLCYLLPLVGTGYLILLGHNFRFRLRSPSARASR